MYYIIYNIYYILNNNIYFIFSINLFMHSFYSPLSSYWQNSSPFLPPLLFWKWEGPLWVPTHPATSFPTEAWQGFQLGEKDPWAGNRVTDSPCMKIKLHTSYICTGEAGTRSSPRTFFGCWFSLCEPTRVQVSWLRWSSCGVPIPSRSLNSSPNSSTRLPKLHLMSDCGLCICLD